MASINGLSSSSTSSIYGNRNIISGLASGMDTESMIENSVAGYKEKLSELYRQQTKLSWKQDAYRDITDRLIDLSQKYTSYSSSSNLRSPSYFNNAVITTTGGESADMVSATGKSTSDIQINGVYSLASAARYSVGVGHMANGVSATGNAIDWAEKVDTSNISGSLTLTYGNRKIDLNFGELEAYPNDNPQELARAIQAKLSDEKILIGSEYVKASDRINVEVKDGNIVFSDKSTAGNSVYISGASGDIKKTLGITPVSDPKDASKANSLNISGKTLSKKVEKAEYLSGKTVEITLDGVTKKVKIGDLTKAANKSEELKKSLQDEIDKQFGAGKITVDTTGNKLDFKVPDGSGSSLKVTSEAGEALGIGKYGATNYLNTSKTLGDLSEQLGLKDLSRSVVEGKGTTATKLKDDDGNLVKLANLNKENGKLFLETDKALADGTTKIQLKDDQIYKDASGNRVVKALMDDGTEKLMRLTDDNKIMTGYDLTINGEKVGTFSDDTALESVITAINSSDAGVKVSYSQMTNKFTFTANEMGAGGKIDFGDDLAKKLFAPTGTGAPEGKFTAGQDAVVSARVNGEDILLTRSSNVINMDGLSVTLKGTFNKDIFNTDTPGKITANPDSIATEDKRVSFTTKSDSDSLVETIKGFVEDINEIMKTTHDAFSTQPAKKSGSRYETYQPLTEEDKEGMSDSEIERYEEKAKQGLLFGDSDLSGLYSRLRSAISTGLNGADLRSIGISTEYDDGVTTLKIDENKLRSALETDPDKVKDVFTDSVEGGSSRDGVMATLKKTLDTYASTSIASPGILVRRAGTTKSSLSLMNNTVQDQIDNLDDQMDRWQTKMSDKIDYYTRQFTALEQLMSSMNSQSSMLSGLMGGY